MIDIKKMTDEVNQIWDHSIIPSLAEYIKIPNKSPHFSPDWQKLGYMDDAVNHIKNWCLANGPEGMTLEVLQLEGRTPLIYIEVEGHHKETTLMYGHLDKQPEMSGWDDDLGPWKPVKKNGKLYGRGGADDGYAAYAALTAIKSLQSQKKPHNKCVIIIEASEESGSMDLPYYMEHLKPRLGTPGLIVCLDSGCGNYDQLWMTTSLRGNIVGELEVSLLKEGVHSGNGSGIASDSFRVVRQLLSRIENQNTGEILVEQLHCEIPEERVNEAHLCAGVLKESVHKSLPFHKGVKPVISEICQLILNQTWRPSLCVTGAEGLPSLTDAGNVLRPFTTLKLSLRTPPLTDALSAANALKETLEVEPPYGAHVSFHIHDAANGWHTPQMSDWLKSAVNQASNHFYQKDEMYTGEGGTIPFMAMLGDVFPHSQFVITGLLGPASNAHGPNEFLHIDMGKKLTMCVSWILHEHYKQSIGEQ